MAFEKLKIIFGIFYKYYMRYNKKYYLNKKNEFFNKMLIIYHLIVENISYRFLINHIYATKHFTC